MTKKFQTKISDPKLAAKISSQYNASEHIREILAKYHDGELVDKSALKEMFKNEKTRLECILLKIKIRQELINMGHKGTEAIEIANGQKILDDNGLVTVQSQQQSEGMTPPEEKKGKWRDHFCTKNKHILGFAFFVNKCPYCGEVFEQ